MTKEKAEGNKEEKENELSLVINGKRFFGWDSVRVTRGIERLPTDFEISLMDYSPESDEQQWVSAGDACELFIGDDRVMVGYIDAWNGVINKSQHQITVSGRGKCQDLVDCSAEWPNNVISQSTALQIAQKLAQSYGIDVACSGENGALQIIPQFTLNWGESSQQVIDRCCRYSALLYYEQEDGSLLLTRVSDEVAASGVELGKNIESADFTDSMNDRYSDYIGVSLSISPFAGDYSAVQLAYARDPEASKMRYRNYVTLIESNLLTAKREQESIDWEMNRRYGRSKFLRVMVDSWRDVSGKLWQPNTLIPIHIPVLGIVDKQWTLSDVTFMRDLSGTRALLQLMPPEAFIAEPYEFYQTIRV